MSAYPPPTEDLAIFNTNNYEYADTMALTFELAKKYFLQYPTAQGTENFLDANVANRLLVNGLIEFGDGTTQTTASNGYVGIYPTFYAYLNTTSSFAPVIYLNFTGASWNINDYIVLDVSIQALYEDGTYSSFNGFIDVYPYRVPTNSGTIANINNDINGDNSFIYSNATYAPNGRYYYSHGYTLQGANNLLYVHSNNQSQLGFYVSNPNNPQFAKVNISVKISSKGSNLSPITLTGITSYDDYNSVNF